MVSKNNKKIKRLQAQKIRKSRTIHCLIQKLNSYKYLSNDSAEAFMQNFNEMAIDLFKNQSTNSDRNTGRRYEKSIKEFAVTLHYHSPRGYRFVRKALCLPSPSTIRGWAANVEAEPGFLMQVIKSISNLVKSDQRDCIIILDEMALKAQTLVEKRSGRLVGNVDYGCIQGEAKENTANHALVVMVVGLKEKWQYPIAYFLTTSINADIQAQIIRESVQFLTESSLEVHAVVFDGTSKNLTTADRLGCKISSNFDGCFKHPCREGRKIYIILDACHMIKLARNALADIGIIKDSCNGIIKWDFIVKLHQIQAKDILHLGNKLKGHHIKWQNHKMKVKIAAQTLSASVAAAINFLSYLKTPGFENSVPTTNFIQKMNDMFDILNSKNKFGKAAKQPVTRENITKIELYLQEIETYLVQLRDQDENLLFRGRRKTFIVGFITSAKSVLAISKDLLYRENNPLQYVLTYKFSQDPLEMFFSTIRGRFGWNNNPNVLEFKYAIRALLLKNNIDAPGTGNCTDVGEDSVQSPNDVFFEPDENSAAVDPVVYHLLKSSTDWKYDALFYIGGFIAKKMVANMKCPECAAALYQSSNQDHVLKSKTTLLSFKAYGNLFVPSSSLCRVVQTTDKLVREMLINWHEISKQKKERVVLEVVKELKNRVFLMLQEHSMQSHILDAMEDDHITTVIKCIARYFIEIFLNQFSKVHTERIVKSNRVSKRQKLTKAVLFYHD